ncbi:response regulator transcription factor [Pedobacter frigiditerrae]|uniref:Response regulator transcription factor n=1 Tax=Pedobacter frigiditerrae TaxID=2530452 RepID=A0A4R0MJP0_9SPHI|nr:LytTR family DNA-binding domain-containing protein [Pedobacter frigiditerrae]TCC86623.1 response regulator transcription factor [Pedobacter frigiditerrae]
MRAVLVDDEQTNLKNLEILLTAHCPSVKIVGTAKQVTEAVSLISLQQPDLLFLDIQMGKQSGFDLLNLLPEKTFEVIFVTAYDRYGIQAVKFAALDYLLKPVNIEELVAAVAKAESRLRFKTHNEQLSFLLQHIKQPQAVQGKIALPTQNEIRYVEISDIMRCEASNTYTFFYLVGGDKILISKSLKEYADLLKLKGFLRTHQTHLINPAFVTSWLKEDGGVLLMKNGDKIPVSKPNREMIKEALGK